MGRNTVFCLVEAEIFASVMRHLGDRLEEKGWSWGVSGIRGCAGGVGWWGSSGRSRATHQVECRDSVARTPQGIFLEM
jgi:hypothetical protein